MILVLLLCGPPGVGKSTVATMLIQMLEDGFEVKHHFKVRSKHLEFDSVQTHKDQWDEHSFRASRDEGLQQLKRLIQATAVDCRVQLSETGHTAPTIIVVDDIMYLHSMRRAVYVAARDLDVRNLITVRVAVDLSVAVARNSLRDESRRMSEDTINKIYSRFEELNSSLVHEKVNTSIDTTSYASLLMGLSAVVEMIRVSLAEGSPSDNVQSSEVAVTATPAEDRPNPSLVFLLDLELRKAVSLLMARIADILGIKQMSSVRSKISQIVTRTKTLTLEAARKHADQSHRDRGVRGESAGEYGSGGGYADSVPEENRFISFFYSNLKSAIEREIDSTSPPPPADEGATATAFGAVLPARCPPDEGSQTNRRVTAVYKALLDVVNNRDP